jgi:hypothetical protein
MSFLENYEDVNSRIKRFHQEFPSGRLVAFIEAMDIREGWILFRAEAYREYEDEKPSAIDYALGDVKSLPNNMKKWMVEDTSTSAYGRVIGLLSPSEGGRPTRQDMERVEVLPASADPWTIKPELPMVGQALAEISSQLGGELVKESPQCQHGHMIWNQAKEGAAKNWGGYFCPEKSKASQCNPFWHVFTSDGKWKPQV